MARVDLLAIRPKCAVCGDTTSINVKLCWQRRDGVLFDICLLCAETPGKVNAESVNTYGPSPIQDVAEHAAWSEARAEAGYPD